MIYLLIELLGSLMLTVCLETDEKVPLLTLGLSVSDYMTIKCY